MPCHQQGPKRIVEQVHVKCFHGTEVYCDQTRHCRVGYGLPEKDNLFRCHDETRGIELERYERLPNFLLPNYPP